MAIASVDKYHPNLLPHIDTIKAMGKASEERHGLNHMDFDDAPEAWGAALREVNEYGGRERYPFTSGVYSIPFLNPQYCDALLTEIAAMSFEVNPDEDEEVQIPEITLADNCPALHSCLHGLFNNVVNPLTQVLYQLEQAQMSSIQFAQYRPDNTAKGHWHHDKDSDITLVVALSDFHKGGGTMVKPQGLGEPFEVPQLPVGHGMLFQGSRTLHMGLPVTEGARNLLVFWSELK
ncbi:hypothetical protein [Pseudomonas guariconensis]|uniref:hypothetical protein n=1 Tax=Pseudomonas guariconensis TaxID=1288410 RepID=UPI002B059873|nr:hypothetical protein [Pseudomonas guariconensis]